MTTRKRKRKKNPATSLSHVPVETIRREAATLRELLTSSLWGLELRPVKLGRDEPALVRAFWAEIGWDDSLLDDLGPPQLKASARVARDLLEDYDGWGAELRPSALPARYRVVLPDHDGVGFAVTDESGGALDPPVIGLTASDGHVERIGESYLRQATYSLVFAATRPWYHARITSKPPIEELALEQPLPNLAPGVRKLSEELWLLPDEPDLPDTTNEVAVRSFEGLWRWLSEAEVPKRMGISPVPGATRRQLEVSADAIRAATPGWREIAGIRQDGPYRVGSIGDAPVILDLGKPSGLVCSARHDQAVAAEAAARGWIAQGK